MEILFDKEINKDPIEVGDGFLVFNDYYILHLLDDGYYALLSICGRMKYLYDTNFIEITHSIRKGIDEGEIKHFSKSKYIFKLTERR